ncbi:MAG: hypothetical protein ACK5FE_06710 [Cyanobacteriota bacterium]|jgi:hypothetical protein
MEHPIGSVSSRTLSPRGLMGFGHWLADAINHAFGNPREEAAHQPPMVGVQPYRDAMEKRRARQKRY